MDHSGYTTSILPLSVVWFALIIPSTPLILGKLTQRTKDYMSSNMASNSGEDSTSLANRLLTPHQRPLQNPRHLLRLPNELLHQILTSVPRPSQLALRHVCRELHNRTPPVPQLPMHRQQSVCEKNAIARANEENINLQAGKRRCIICGQLAQFDRFRFLNTPICNWHDGWLFKRSIPDTMEPHIQRRLEAVARHRDCWVSLERTYCAHTKDILNWDVPACNCECEYCGHFTLTCYVRISQDDARGLELDLVEGSEGLEVLERKRQDGPYGLPQERRVAVVPLASA